MQPIKQIEILFNLEQEAESLKDSNVDNPKFKIWKLTVEDRLSMIFGDFNTQSKRFKDIKFERNPTYAEYLAGVKFEKEVFNKGIEDAIILFQAVRGSIEEFGDYSKNEVAEKGMNKIFISHSSRDIEYVEEVVEMLKVIGLSRNQIFCSSFEGYGVELGEDFLERIKSEINSNSIVLFVITPNYFESQISMCEMGAAWVLSKIGIPILIPPLGFDDLRAVIPTIHGLKINDSKKWNSLKYLIQKEFGGIKHDDHTWEPDRDRILNRIEKLIQ
ncbi:toll/interleukin-1 receptor domain-containing protein [Algoriphagus pacificus]|uniref:Toll/interleukin-1 receptor domain-containing protein n=1 Tax=Algoriphagus pacificus TaxID=2811234 RepID=A0ABS3CI75_9BACT|nr:toll/interleukin-1 receptor domain-containing protein [Algoriphagus pacificus]MBN7816799.1 toll/interleukin-1 receptor domain-containing protein [Algoriphagus pacificus]